MFTRRTTTAHAEERMDPRGHYKGACFHLVDPNGPKGALQRRMCSLGGPPQPLPMTNGPERGTKGYET